MPFDCTEIVLREIPGNATEPRLAYGPLYCDVCGRSAPPGASMGDLCNGPSAAGSGTCPGRFKADWQPD